MQIPLHTYQTPTIKVRIDSSLTEAPVLEAMKKPLKISNKAEYNNLQKCNKANIIKTCSKNKHIT